MPRFWEKAKCRSAAYAITLGQNSGDRQYRKLPIPNPFRVAPGGIDPLVFTGGIGGNDEPTRESVVITLSGMVKPVVQTLPPREDDEIVRHPARLATAISGYE